MNKIFRYRRHIMLIEKWLPIMLIPTIILLSLGIYIQGVGPFLIMVGLLNAGYYFILKRLYSRLSSLELTIDDIGIRYINSRNNIFIKYEDIKYISNKSVRNIGGWITIKSFDNQSIKLTVVLENIADFILTLKNKLDELDLSNRYDEKDLIKFYTTAAYSDDSWRRLYYRFKKVLLITILNVIVSIIYSIFILSDSIGILAFLLSIIVSSIVYLIVEYAYFAPKIKRGIDYNSWQLPKENIENEKSIMSKLTYLYGGLFWILLIVFNFIYYI
ncbi:hypothetical protein RJG79_07985 [Mycoplasmatota bacterium WC44]